jgi:putative membrane protein
MPGEASEHDVTRRTWLANERTYLAWWRTGLTTLTVALAAARVVPELSKATHRWPYTVLGAAFAVLGTFCIGYAEWRRVAVEKALREDRYAGADGRVTLGITVAGVVLGLGMLVIILAEA